MSPSHFLPLPPSLRQIRQQAIERPVVSCAIRVKNELQGVRELYECLEAQIVSEVVELVFLDSGSTDGTVEYLSSLDVSLYSIAPSDFHFGRTCNWMLELTSGEVVVFLSGHVRLSSTRTLAEILRVVRADPYAAGYLRQVPNPAIGESAYDRAYLKRRYPERGITPVRMTVPGGFSNAASFIPRKAWYENPFPEMIASEDYYWAETHLRAGHPLFYLPQLLVQHSHGESAEAVGRRVRLNVEARFGNRPPRKKALTLYPLIFISMMMEGASVRDAMRYSYAHASAYWPGL